jgi:hypothetical protein
MFNTLFIGELLVDNHEHIHDFQHFTVPDMHPPRIELVFRDVCVNGTHFLRQCQLHTTALSAVRQQRNAQEETIYLQGFAPYSEIRRSLELVH